MKAIIWKWDKDVFVPHCPHCDDLVYEKDHCVFCHQPYEWVDPEKTASGGWPPSSIAEVNSGEYRICVLYPGSNRIHLYKNGHPLMVASYNKIMTKAELLQLLAEKQETLDKLYERLFPEG